jgi:lipopolysaccharide export LptBFGC system permease protein LptF
MVLLRPVLVVVVVVVVVVFAFASVVATQSSERIPVKSRAEVGCWQQHRTLASTTSTKTKTGTKMTTTTTTTTAGRVGGC